MFSGLDTERRLYDFASWRYEDGTVHSASGARRPPRSAAQESQGTPSWTRPGRANRSQPGPRTSRPGASRRCGPRRAGEAHGSGGAAAEPFPDTDPTLQHPRCVFQILKRHFARYTPELVQEACGIPPERFAEVARLITENSGRERTTAFVYSVGWTQHTVGVQYIRTASILQLLLGNIGRPGGGILALRGHASIQGSTDIPTLFDLLPGYLPMPHVIGNDDLDTYVRAESVSGGFWANTRSYTVSLLKAWWGDAATADNDFCYGYLPRLTGSHGTYETVRVRRRAPARATSCSARTLRSARPTAGCSGWPWPISTGWWSATSS